jgi:hypothetical protein
MKFSLRIIAKVVVRTMANVVPQRPALPAARGRDALLRSTVFRYAERYGYIDDHDIFAWDILCVRRHTT